TGEIARAGRDIVKSRILEGYHEQERTFCKFGWRRFAGRGDFRAPSWLRRDATYRRRHLGAAKRSESSVGGSSPGRGVGCQFHRYGGLLRSIRKRGTDCRSAVSLLGRPCSRHQGRLEPSRPESVDSRCHSRAPSQGGGGKPQEIAPEPHRRLSTAYSRPRGLV